MYIDVKRLNELGFAVECTGPKDSIETIRIWPRRGNAKLVEILEKEADLQPKYLDEVIEAIHELQVIQAVRRT